MDGSNLPANSNNIDPDILQSQNDVLRAKDIYPPYDKNNEKEREGNNPGQARHFPVPEFDNPEEDKNSSADQSQQEDDESRPRFHLGMEILENQRRAAGMLRKAPVPKRIPPKPQQENNLEKPETEQITQTRENAQIDDEILEQEIEVEQTCEEKNANQDSDDNYHDDPIEDIFTEKPVEIDTNAPAENYNISSHVANMTKIRLNRTEESLIADIVARDIEQFLKSA